MASAQSASGLIHTALRTTMLGHASAVMTLDRYGHLMPGRAQEIADRLGALVRAAAAEPAGVMQIDGRDLRGMEPAAAVDPEG